MSAHQKSVECTRKKMQVGCRKVDMSKLTSPQNYPTCGNRHRRLEGERDHSVPWFEENPRLLLPEAGWCAGRMEGAEPADGQKVVRKWKT